MSDQLARLVTVSGAAYSSGSIHANVNRTNGVGPGVSVGELLRGLGDVQRITPAGEIDLLTRAGFFSAATLDQQHVLPSSRYSIDLDTTLKRVIAFGADVSFIASGELRRVIEGGAAYSVATITAPTNTEVRVVRQVIARAAIVGKFDVDDQLDGVWDPDTNRFEWSGTLAVGESAPVELHGTWRTEDTVVNSAADPLAGDQVLDVPVTNTTGIRAAAKRLLDQHRLPVELMDLSIVLGVRGVPRLAPGDAVQIALALQQELEVHAPNDADLWLVHAQELTQPSVAQAAVQLHLSRRLPDYRTRDFWSRADMSGSGGRQIVVGSGSGAPQIAQVIPVQALVFGGAPITLALGDYFSDPDGDMLTYAVVSADPGSVTAAVVGSVLTMTPGAVGVTTVTVTASDATRSAAQIFSVEVRINRAPVSDATISTQDIAIIGTVNLGDYFSDPDGDPLTYTAVSNDTSNVDVMVAGKTAALIATGAGSASVTVTASDGILTVSQTFTVNASLSMTWDTPGTFMFKVPAGWTRLSVAVKGGGGGGGGGGGSGSIFSASSPFGGAGGSGGSGVDGTDGRRGTGGRGGGGGGGEAGGDSSVVYDSVTITGDGGAGGDGGDGGDGIDGTDGGGQNGNGGAGYEGAGMDGLGSLGGPHSFSQGLNGESGDDGYEGQTVNGEYMPSADLVITITVGDGGIGGGGGRSGRLNGRAESAGAGSDGSVTITHDPT